MKITLLRHTEVDEAFHGCYNGHIDIALSEKGEKQASHLGREFAGSHFDLVYCSDLKRTRDTLKYFSQNKEAVFTSKLREKSWGKHEGKSFSAIIAEGDIEYVGFLQWIDALDGEAYREYVKRVKKFFLEFLVQQNAQTVLVVTHAGVIRVLISLVKNISLEEAFSTNISYGAYLVLDTNSMCFSEVKY